MCALEIKQLTSSRVNKLVHHALRDWNQLSEPSEEALNDLLLFRNQASHAAPTLRKEAENAILSDCLEELAERDQLSADILRERFVHKKKIVSVAYKLNFSPDQINRRQRAAIDKLTEIVIDREMQLRDNRLKILETRLETPSYQKLFGFDTLISKVEQKLTNSGPPFIISILGLGGIGKTALADAAVRKTLEVFCFEDVIWVREADHDRDLMLVDLLANKLIPLDSPPKDKKLLLRQTLKGQPYLIVIDNLGKGQDIEKLLIEINDLAGPSKFLLTTREEAVRSASVWGLKLSELRKEDALKVMLQHAEQIGLAINLDEIKDQSDTIYQVIGGNPLALKLMVGLLDALPFQVVLDDFRNAGIKTVEEMYRNIYWQAWRTIENNAKTLLVGMMQASTSGVTLENMAAFSGLREKALLSAVQTLFKHSLMERRGNPDEARYGIHPLTLSFLMTEIVHWPL